MNQSQLMKEAHLHMPQGVAENYRYWGDDKTVFVKHAKGCQLIDSDGKAYVDFRLGYGPIIWVTKMKEWTALSSVKFKAQAR